MRLFLALSFIVILAATLFLLCYFATGWVQFGSRYFMDITPLAFLLILFVIDDIPGWLQIVLFLYGFIVNLLGIVALSYIN